MLPRGVPYLSVSASASTSTASPRLEVTRLLGRSASLLSRLPTIAGSSSIHPATPVVDRAVHITEPTDSIQPHLIRPTRHAYKRPARAVGGRRVSARRAAEAGDAFDLAMASRAAKRARNMASWTPALPSLTYLRQSSITNKSLQSYMKLLAGFLTFWRSEVWPHRVGEPSNLEMDAALERYMEEVFKRGELSQCGSKLIAVIKFFNPIFGRDGTMTLPYASQALRGWRLKAPGRTRLPLPWEVVCLSALQLVRTGMFTTALYVMLCFSAYLRPSEPFSISGKQIVGPVPGTRHKYWSVILHPWEDGRVSKTLQVDETVLIDLDEYQFIANALRFLKSVTPDAEYAFQFSQTQARDRFQKACQAWKLDVLEPELYQLRHSGPSHDKATLLRTLAEIKDRGRWGSDITVKRYKKEGRVAQQLHKLPPSTRVAAMAAPTQLAEAFWQPLTAPFPPHIPEGLNSFDRRRF